MIIATSYLPPLWYFSKLIAAETVVIESREHFVKQTIRNRCHILSPNGVQSLIVPVEHKNRYDIPIKDIRISYDLPWQKQHWRSLCAAYRRSAFFEFYQDELNPFYEKHFEFLLDYNTELLRFLMECLKTKVSIDFTLEYHPLGENHPNDIRMACNTGLPVVTGNELSYPQVFGYKHGFTPGLSLVDLLFSMGPESRRYL